MYAKYVVTRREMTLDNDGMYAKYVVTRRERTSDNDGMYHCR